MKWFAVVANCHDGVTEFSYHWYNRGMHGSGKLSYEQGYKLYGLMKNKELDKQRNFYQDVDFLPSGSVVIHTYIDM